MKTLTTTILTLFLWSYTVAQEINWFPQGAEWYYTPHCMTEQHCGVVHFQVVADTLIAGKLAKKITREQTAWGPVFGVDQSHAEFLRFENDTVYRFSTEANLWHFLYCFNAQAGDVWEIQNETYVGYESLGVGEPIPTFIVQVDSVIIQEIAGSDRRVVYTSAVGETDYHYIGHLVEGVGSIGLCFGLIGESVPQILGGYISFFNCYIESGNLIYGSPASPCGTVGIEENNSFQITIQPNPAKEFITINLTEKYFPNQAVLSVYNIHGQLISTTALQPGSSSHTMDVNMLTPGLYILNCTTPVGVVWAGKIVVE